MPIKHHAFYHFYNHAISNESLFRTDDNFCFFFDKYLQYVQPMVKTYAYCLMPNHFHFMIQIRDEKEIIDFFNPNKNLAGFENLQGLLQAKINKQFSNFFNSYAKAYNKVFDRKGKLFRNSMKLKEVDNEGYLKKLIHYIHLNPVIHGFVEKPEEWKYSSFQAFTSGKNTMLERNDVISMFSGESGFIENHKHKVDLRLLDELEF